MTSLETYESFRDAGNLRERVESIYYGDAVGLMVQGTRSNGRKFRYAMIGPSEGQLRQAMANKLRRKIKRWLRD